MCLDPIFRHIPCIGTQVYTWEEDPTPCSSLTRIALGIASIAAAIFSTSIFLATSDMLALGLTVALAISAICLWPKGGAGAPPPPVVPIIHAFGAAIPRYPYAQRQTLVAHYPPAPPSFVMQPTVYPGIPVADPERRIQPGDRRRVDFPISSPMMGRASPFTGDEDRVRVGDRGRATTTQRVGPMMGPPPSVHQGNIPSPLYPQLQQQDEGEQRIGVGRGGATRLPSTSSSGDDRIPVGSSHRRK